MADPKTGPRRPLGTYTFELAGLEPGAPRPALIVQAVGAKGTILHSAPVGDDGGFALPAEILDKARHVAIGAAEGDEAAAGAAVRFRPTMDAAAGGTAGPVALRYLGLGPFTSRSPQTGRLYACSASEATVRVDTADVQALLRTRLFRRI